MKKKIPRYCWFGDIGSCAMKISHREEEPYGWDKRPPEISAWRDAGQWRAEVRVDENGNLWSTGFSDEMSYLNNKPFFPCTKAEWKKDNKGYV